MSSRSRSASCCGLARLSFQVLVAVSLALAARSSASQALEQQTAFPILDSFVDFCLKAPPEDKAFTCVIEERLSPDPSRFQRLTYEGITKGDTDPETVALVNARSNVYAFMLTGKRYRLIREHSSECVHVLLQNELTGADPLAALGPYTPEWDTNYTICQLYDGKGRMGYQRAQATPRIRSVITEEEASPWKLQNLHLLYGLEANVTAVLLSLLDQTNVVQHESCNPLREDFSSAVRSKNEMGIRQALATGAATILPTDTEGVYRLQFRVGNGQALINVDFAPQEALPVSRVEAWADNRVVRTITRQRVVGHNWFAEWEEQVMPAAGEEVLGRRVYYFNVEETDPESELRTFVSRYIQGSRQKAHKNRSGEYTEWFQGRKTRVYSHDELLRSLKEQGLTLDATEKRVWIIRIVIIVVAIAPAFAFVLRRLRSKKSKARG